LFAPFAYLLATRRVLTQYDLTWFNLPLRFLYHQALRAGDTFTWTPAIFTGFYIQGDGQIGLTHPLHLLLYRFLPLTAAFDLESVVSYAVAYAGMFVLLRRFALTRGASLVGAMLFAFSGFNLLHYCHMNAVAVVAHMPWMLAAVDEMVRAARGRRALAAAAFYALCTGSQILLGYPQYVWITLQLSAAFALIRLERPRGLVLLAAAVAAGAAVGAAQLLPNIDALEDSSRGGMGIAFALGYSEHPWNVLQLWAPYALRDRAYLMPNEVEAMEFGLYNGAFCSAALLWLYARRKELGAMRRLVVGTGISAVIFLVLAFGRFGGLGYLVAHLPVVGVFRAPAREVSAVHLCFAVLGAIAFDDLLRLRREGRTLDFSALRPLAVVIVLLVLTAALRAAPMDAIRSVAPRLEWSSVLRMLRGVVIVVATVSVMVLAARGVRQALPVLVLVIAADLGLWGWTYVWNPPPQSIPAIATSAWTPPGGHPGDTIHEAYGIPAADMPVLSGYRVFNGYVGMWPARTLPLDSPAAERLGGANWRHDASGWHAVPDPMPRARLVSDVRASADIALDVESIDIRSTALVPQAAGSFAGTPGQARVVSDRPGAIVIDATAPARQLLVLTESFHRGWRARVDGAAAGPVRAYGDHLAVAVDAGAHRVELTFAPASARIGIATSTLATVLLSVALVWLAAAEEKRRRNYSRGADEG
jgi:hypothetical protein